MGIYDLVQRAQIRSAHSRVASAEAEMMAQRKSTNYELDGIDQRIDRLSALCETMWELLKETTGLTDAHLEHKLHELDMVDGRRDLKRRKTASRCQCGAMVPAQAKVCQFCSAPPPTRSAFDTV